MSGPFAPDTRQSLQLAYLASTRYTHARPAPRVAFGQFRLERFRESDLCPWYLRS
jgi:hypothetical protein